ncbi:DUF4194 domain-containing protein [Diaphorobacter aerolatus]|uniref:DUF4194 domain-containing protein n=1 Tax=Diaphorobacter aerolatus TaxID=1288495 RepID=UPI001D014517|nr:DUF4194 domain-containing protein [Diaphorobacter aerolatus]
MDLFDQWASASASLAQPQSQPGSDAPDIQPNVELAGSDSDSTAERTAPALRRAVQELLKHGSLERSAKPHLFATVQNRSAVIGAMLEPFDLQVQIDELRGLVFLTVLTDDLAGEAVPEEDEDGWSHPLVFRQRLTLEQSLLVAILRREFIQHEQEGGLGVTVRIAVDDLQPQLDVFMDRSGSETQDRKRLLQLLDNLRKHGMVSEVDAQDYVLIRPMIVHLANPENLQALLLHLQRVAGGEIAGDAVAGNGDDREDV